MAGSQTPASELRDRAPSQEVWRSLRVRLGAVLLLVASLQLFVAMGVEQVLRPGYSLTGNYISDLGVDGPAGHPGWGYDWVFNGSVILLGILAVVGILCIRPVFPARRSTFVSLVLLMLGSAGAVAVGLFPETSPALSGHAHDVASVWTFAFANLGLLILGLTLWKSRAWRAYASWTTFLGALSVVSLVFYLYYEVYGGNFWGIGPGGLERVVAFPVLLWAILVGVVILLYPRSVGDASPTQAENPTGDIHTALGP